MANPGVTPKNLKKTDDPCRTQPGTALDFYLAANATQAGEAPFLDCILKRDFRMRSLLPPKVIAEDEDRPDGFIAKFLDALDREANAAFARVDCFPTIRDPLRAPENFLDLLLYDLGSPFTLEEGLTSTEKRQLAIVLFTLYALKGTCFGVIGAIKVIYGINATECPSGTFDCWSLGEDLLNISTDLCGTSAFDKRTFAVMVDINLTDKQRLQMANIVNWAKPANTHFVGFIEPGNPNHTDHWELEFSELNFNTDLH